MPKALLAELAHGSRDRAASITAPLPTPALDPTRLPLNMNAHVLLTSWR